MRTIGIRAVDERLQVGMLGDERQMENMFLELTEARLKFGLNFVRRTVLQ